MIRFLLMSVLLTAILPGAEPVPLLVTVSAGVEVVMVTVPVTWHSAIIQADQRAAFLTPSERVLVNGGYFDGESHPDGLLISEGVTSGRLRSGSPYSGFLWADRAGQVRIAEGQTVPTNAVWAIQSGPVLVSGGRCAINRSTHSAPRSVIAVRNGQTVVVRSASIGLKELADFLVAAGIDSAINLDGGPSSSLQAAIGTSVCERKGMAEVPYFLGFAPRAP